MGKVEKNNSTSKLLSIELLKCLAALMITNSHFKPLYIEPFTALGTFGAPGNALFFFLSGYTLALSQRKENFINWFKRRSGRIYPSLLSWGTLIGPLLFGITISWNVWLGGNYWFIHCIFIYYIFIYVILNYLMRYFKYIFILSVILSIVYFFNMPVTKLSIYQVDFHYVSFFTLMLLGIYCSKNRFKIKNTNKFLNILICVFSFCLFYGIQFVGKGQVGWKYYFQVVSLFPLYTWIYYLYIIIHESKYLNNFLSKTVIGYCVRFVSALTLEIYLVGFILVMTQFNNLFPLNLIIVFVIILLAAYLVNIFSNLIIQILSPNEFNLKNIFVIVK